MSVLPSVSSLLLYVREPQRIADFYVAHFGFVQKPGHPHDLLELVLDGRFTLLLHPASKGHRLGQSCVKLVFDVDDLGAFKTVAARNGLRFGATHRGDGYEFANARDPAKNPIQISRRALLGRQRDHRAVARPARV